MHSTLYLEYARNGDPGAVCSLVDALRPRISRMAIFYARRCGEDADDLCQEAWMGLLESLPCLDLSIGNPEQYLLKRARWRLLDYIKRARIRRCLSLDEVSLVSLTTHDSALSLACAAEFFSLLRAPQQAVLECLLAGLTWREAGAALGCTSANIAYHVRRIKERYEEWACEKI